MYIYKKVEKEGDRECPAGRQRAVYNVQQRGKGELHENRKCEKIFEYDEGIRWVSRGRAFEEEEIVQKF